MPGINLFFNTLNTQNFPFVLATNNASKTQAQYIEKLGRFGVTVTQNQILTSAIATADFLSQEYSVGTTAYVSGGKGIQDAMRAKQFAVVSKEEVRQGAQPELCVVGLSFDTCYDDMACAAVAINRGARFIGTNPDTSFPSDWGILPGAGSLLALLETATGQKPLVIGKPGPHLFEAGLRLLNAEKESTAMIGDRLGTDIAGGHAVGLKTILVLSGITQLEEIEQSALKPDFVFEGISEIARGLS